MKKDTEAQLIQRYQTLAEVSPVGIFHTDANGYTTYVNPRWCQISGLSFEQALGNGWFNAVHEADREGLQKGWKTATKTKKISFSEYRFVRPDGSIAWVIGQAIPEKNAANEIVGYVGTTTDITERKIAEEEIARAYKEKETVLNRINDAVVSVDNEWRYTFLNDASLATHPLGREGTLGKVIWDIHPPMRNTIFWDKYHEAMATRKVVEIESVYDPMKMWFSVKVYPSHDGLTIFYKDISERKEAEEAIKRNEQKLELIYNTTQDVIFLLSIKDERFSFSSVNQSFLSITGLTEQQVVGKYVDEIIPEPSLSVAINNYKAAIASKQTAQWEEITPYPTGTKTGIVSVTPVFDSHGQCSMMVGSVHDVTEIKTSSEQLRKLTAHLQNIREEERRRIGREIHDELGQQLTAIKMDVAWIDKQTPIENTAVKSKLKNVITMLDGGNQSIRRILNELRPVILQDYGLLETLKWQGRQFTTNTGIPLDFNTAVTDFKPSDDIATCIFRVYQEALTNITRYAEAKKVLVSLGIADDTLILTIEDDGKGFDTDQLIQKKSFGILGMKERVLSVNGNFDLVAAPGKGTKLGISIPIKN